MVMTPEEELDDFFQATKHLMMADVVNPDNIFTLYGEGTWVRRWLSYKNGIVRTNILSFPPRKPGVPISEQEKDAHERIREATQTYWQWRYNRPSPGCSKMIKMIAERKAREEAQKAKEEEERKKMMNEAKAPKTKVRKKMMMIKARNFPYRSFHLFKNRLKKKNMKRITRMNKGKGKGKGTRDASK